MPKILAPSYFACFDITFTTPAKTFFYFYNKFLRLSEVVRFL